jgi:hypothetical protein
MKIRFVHDGTAFNANHYLMINYVAWEKTQSNSTLGSNVATILANQIEDMQNTTIASGTVAGVGNGLNQLQLDVNASSVDGAYDPGAVFITSGPGRGQSRIILEYTGSTRMCTVNRDWKEAPNTTSTYAIKPFADLTSVNEGLIRAATSNTVQLNTTASTVDGTYVGQMVFIVSGAGSDQTGLITAYNGTTQTATIAGTWMSALDTTSAYVMIPVSPVLLAPTSHPGVSLPQVTSETASATFRKMLNA